MKTIALIGQKGGTGKTTIALGLAVTAAKTGEIVAVIDLDPQANAALWKKRRTENDNPAVVATTPGFLTETLTKAREAGADLVIIDTPGKADTLAVDAARAADLVLIPCQGTVFDMDTLAGIGVLLGLAGDPAAFVLYNGIPPLGSRIADDLKAMTKAYCGVEACPVHHTRRTSYADGPQFGKTASEIEPLGKAAAEMERLYLFTVQQANRLRGKHVEGRNAAKSA